MKHIVTVAVCMVVLFWGATTPALAQVFHRACPSCRACRSTCDCCASKTCGKCSSCRSAAKAPSDTGSATAPAPVPPAPLPGGAIPGQSPSATPDGRTMPEQSDLALEQEMQRSMRGDRVSSAARTFAPNMIGDTNAGGCGALTIEGQLAAFVQHPTFSCSRMNIAENNSAVVHDRIFFTYRHFHNASDVSVFDNMPLGGANSLDINRYTLGFEKKIGGRSSIEVRMPINHELSSDLSFSQVNGASNLPLTDTDTSIGNLGVIFKQALCDRPTFYVSGGVGVNIPTAPDVTMQGHISDPAFAILDGDGNPLIPEASYPSILYNFTSKVENETVNLQPFLGCVWTPTDCFFTQGFLQIDVPLNKSGAALDQYLNVGDNGTVPGTGSDYQTESGTASLAQQTLMRLNAGMGLWLYRDVCRQRALALTCEVHYTTTLQDADIVGPFDVTPPIPAYGISGTTLSVGNLRNRTDVVNLTTGVPITLGKLTVYNGLSVPVSGGDNRGFDCEYTLILDRRF